MVRHSMVDLNLGLQGFTLLEVLVAVLLCAGAGGGSSALDVAQRGFCQLCLTTGTRRQSRREYPRSDLCVSRRGLWPQGAVPTGRWLDGLNADIASGGTAPKYAELR